MAYNIHPPAVREDRFFRKLFLTALSCLWVMFSFAQKQYDLVKDFGAKGDNRTDNYFVFQKAAAALSKAGGGILNIPKGKYYIGKYKSTPDKNGFSATDIVFKDCRSLAINGNGSSIRVNGNFIRTDDHGVTGLSYRYSYKNTVCPIVISNCKNVKVRDLVLDGGVREMRKESVMEGECYGIKVDDLIGEKGESKNITLTNIEANYFATDGFYFRCFGKDIKIMSCKAKRNGRQGLSVVAGKDIVVSGCIFDSTGFTGSYGWHAPGAGIDLENEWGEGKLENVVIKNCMLRHNKGFQVVTTLQSENVTIDSCFFADLTNGYNEAFNGIGMYSLRSVMKNSVLFGSVQVDLAGQIYKGPEVQQFTGNIIYSGNRAIVSADFSRPCNVSRNLFIMLPGASRKEYFPYIQNDHCTFNQNIVVIHASKISPWRNVVTGLVQGVKETKNNLWLMNGYIPKEQGQSVYYYVISFDGGTVPGKQFFPDNEMVRYLNYPYFRLMKKPVQDKILSYAVFSAYQQKAFDRRFLVQLNEIQRYVSDKVTR